MVFELPDPRLGFFALFAAAFFTGKLGVALLKMEKKKQTKETKGCSESIGTARSNHLF